MGFCFLFLKSIIKQHHLQMTQPSSKVSTKGGSNSPAVYNAIVSLPRTMSEASTQRPIFSSTCAKLMNREQVALLFPGSRRAVEDDLAGAWVRREWRTFRKRFPFAILLHRIRS